MAIRWRYGMGELAGLLLAFGLLAACRGLSPPPAVARPAAEAGPCAGLVPTPFFTHYHGQVTVEDRPAPVGTVVEARSPRGERVGCFVVRYEGLFGSMRVYGEETTGPRLPGMRPQETVQFLVGGQPARVEPGPVRWRDDKDLHAVRLVVPAGPER